MKKQLNDDLFEVLLNHAAKDYCERELDILMEQYAGDDRQEEHSEAYKKRMRKLFDRERRKERILNFSKDHKPFKRAAAIFFACVVCVGAASLSIDAFRIKIFNLFRSTNPEYTSVVSVENMNFDKANIPEGWTQVYLPANLPQAFYIKNAHATKHSLTIFYNDDKGNLIKFSQQTAADKGSIWDTQNTELQEIKLEGQLFYVIEKEGQTSIKWRKDGLFFEATSNLGFEGLKPVVTSLEKIIR